MPVTFSPKFILDYKLLKLKKLLFPSVSLNTCLIPFSGIQFHLWCYNTVTSPIIPAPRPPIKKAWLLKNVSVAPRRTWGLYKLFSILYQCNIKVGISLLPESKNAWD